MPQTDCLSDVAIWCHTFRHQLNEEERHGSKKQEKDDRQSPSKVLQREPDANVCWYFYCCWHESADVRISMELGCVQRQAVVLRVNLTKKNCYFKWQTYKAWDNLSDREDVACDLGSRTVLTIPGTRSELHSWCYSSLAGEWHYGVLLSPSFSHHPEK